MPSNSIRLALLLVVLALGTSMPALATRARFAGGALLLEDLASENFVHRPTARSYVMGALDMLAVLDVLPQIRGACPPVRTHEEDVARIVLAYLRAHPDELHAEGAYLVSMARWISGLAPEAALEHALGISGLG
jgi:hypothetical protein